MSRLTFILFPVCLVGFTGCSDGQQTNQPETPHHKPATVDWVVEKGALPTGSTTGPSNQKEMLGLDLKPINGWKPVWDAQAQAARWEHGQYMSSIVVRLVTEKLDGVDDLKQAAPWMLQLGSAITQIIEVQNTSRGWYAVVKREKEKDLVYVLKYGSTNVVCSARLTKSQIKTIKKQTALAACESIQLKD